MTDTPCEQRFQPLAIVGMACRLPGADDLEQFWEMLELGRSAVADLPADRLNQHLYFHPDKGIRNKCYTRRGAVVTNCQFDDPVAVPPRLAEVSDSTHWMMCQVAAVALRNAGIDPFDVPCRNAGVYVGHTIGSGLEGDYSCTGGVAEAAQLLREVDAFREIPPAAQQAIVPELVEAVRNRIPLPPSARDVSSHMVAGIISKAFGLDGPFMAVNAACASSLQALLIAARALQLGSIEMAVVGGASVCSRDWLLLFSAAQSLSQNQVRPFDHRADGIVIGEGYTAIIVKTLDRAIADGDTIHAVIRGIGASSDGRGRSLWAPRRDGQVEAIRRAYRNRGEMADVQYIEAHATATPLGDATEIASLTEVFREVFPAGKKIPIGSVKANIGHLLEAAGLAGVLKAVLCMQRGTIPATLNVEKLSEKIDWKNAPVHVPLKATPWPTPAAGRPRRAGINAFGIGGLNVHVVVDDGTTATEETSPVVVSNRRRGPASQPDSQAVAVVGMGCVFPGALNVPAFQELMASGRDAIGPLPAGRWGTVAGQGTTDASSTACATSRGGFVDGFAHDWRRHRIPPKHIDNADPLQFMVLDAADQALADSGYDQHSLMRSRTGVVVGTEFASDFTDRLQLMMRLPLLQEVLRDLLANRGVSDAQVEAIVCAFGETLHEHWPVLADETGSFSASSLAVRIAKTWDLMGGACAVDSGPSSGLAALANAVDSLVCGDCDLMFCVGAQRYMNPAKYHALSRAGALAPDSHAHVRGPFDRNARGYLPGEGGGVLLLKRLCDARRDGDRVRAVLRGASVRHKNTLDGVRESVIESLAHSAVQPKQVQLFMTDAPGVRADDELIARAAMAIAESACTATPLYVTSIVGQIGHTGGGSGIASLIAAMLSLQQRRAYSVTGLVDRLPIVTRESARVVFPRQHEVLRNSENEEKAAGIVLSHGKGLAWSVVCECPPASEAAPDQVLCDEVQAVRVRDTIQPLTTPSPPSRATQRVARRAVLRLAEAPYSTKKSHPLFRPADAVVVIGDNPVAVALCHRLARVHSKIHRFLPCEGIEVLTSRMETLSAGVPPRHIFIVPSSDREHSSAGNATWLNRREQDLELPFQLLQNWGRLLMRHKMQGPCTLAAITRMGGDLGLTGAVTSPVGGWICGVLKSLRIELKRRQQPAIVKICDFAEDDSPTTMTEALLAELESGCPEREVACGGGRRRVVNVDVQPVESLTRAEVPRGGTWVLTGGARGITAEVAVALGKEFDLRMHLFGRSPAPQANVAWRDCSAEQLREIKRAIVRQAIAEKQSPEKQWDRVKADIEIHDNLRRMKRLGLTVGYHSCDVSDWSTLERELDEVRRQSGPIEGIIHGAGYARSGRFEMVKPDRLRTTIAAKVDGAVGLMELTREDPLRYFVGFGSISGRYGGNGLSDYAGANEMLAKLCASFRHLRADCATTCIDWQSWDEVGMAMVPESTAGTRGVLKMKFIPPSEGVEHLLGELGAGLPECEVLIDDGEFENLL